MAAFQVSTHNGKVLSKTPHRDDAISSANWHARQLNTRVNVYPLDESGDTGIRLVSAYPAGLLFEADIAHLDHREYLRRHAEMAARKAA